MAKKKPTKPQPETKKLTLAEKQKIFEGDLLQGKYDEDHLKRNGLYGHTCKRKIRYWCYKFRNEVVENRTPPPPPKGLKEFIESLPGFAGWKYFAETWDVIGENPFMLY